MAAASAGSQGSQRHPPVQGELSFDASTTLSPNAAAIGAVNTVVLSVEEAIGHNTDSFGFAESFRRGLPGARLDHVVLFGAGGGGMAVAHALLDPWRHHTPDLRPHPAQGRNARRQNSRDEFPEQRVAARLMISAAWVKAASGIVNATPSGMTKYPGSPLRRGFAAPGIVGRRHRLLPGGDCTDQRSEGRGLPYPWRRGHGDLSGRRGLRI